MSLWIEPKTDWTAEDAFDYVAYNRVTGNILYLREYAETLFLKLSELSLETDKENLSLIYARHMNAIENSLDTLNKETYGLGIGEKQTYRPNGNVPLYYEYNRIESASLLLYKTMKAQKDALPRLAFTLGGQKGIKV